MTTPRPTPPRHDLRPAVSLIVFMLLAVAGVAALAFWGEVRESRAALGDFAREQATLARAIAAQLTTQLAAAGRDPALRAEVLAGRVPAAVLDGAAQVERSGAVRVLFLGPRGEALLGTDGGAVESAPIRAALATSLPSIWLQRPEAGAIGLPPRRAAVGLAAAEGGPLGRFGVAVASSAERMRDREARGRARLGLGVLLAAGLVSVFGSLALHRQRRGLLLERELSLSAVARARDAELSTASRAAMMGTLAMGIAHEISTPLGIIAGRAEQLAPRVEGDERAARAVQAILEQGERIRRVIQGFLGLARGGAPALADAAPAAVVEAATALVEHRFGAAGVTLAADVPAELPSLHGDAPMLQQALVNLLLNACDACERGGHVTVRVRSDGDRLAFTVADDGRGISAEEAERALEPFFTTKSAGHGTGLGLAIANEIVKLHRGTLALRAASPRGTHATLILPVPRVPHG
jgi:signal transduction histidine kinase